MVTETDSAPEDGADQQRDALLLKLLKTPPQPRPKRERKPGKAEVREGQGPIDNRP